METAGHVTNADYREVFGVGRRQAKAELASWLSTSVVELRGEGRGAHYVAGPAWPPR
jgi:hypothetical protein